MGRRAFEPALRGGPSGRNGRDRTACDLFSGSRVRVVVAAKWEPVGAGHFPRGIEHVDGPPARKYISFLVNDTSSPVAAFFDVDRTLIEINSGRAWIEHQWRTGQISIFEATRSVWWLSKYWLSILAFDEVTTKVVQGYAGTNVAELEAEIRRWFDENIAQTICKEARIAVEKHRAQGHILVILTSGSQFSTRPLQQALEIDHLVCTEVEQADGILTGDYRRPAAYGEGKLRWAREFAERQGVNLAHSFFYTDSYSDRPMLDAVGEPRVINPDPRLRRYAIVRDWEIRTWRAENNIS